MIFPRCLKQMGKTALFSFIRRDSGYVGSNWKKPYNMGFAYAYIDGQWVECIADAFLQIHGRSEHEWNLILEEWREHQRQHHEKRVTLNGKLLAEFLRELEKDEAWQLQRLRDLEEQPQ